MQVTPLNSVVLDLRTIGMMHCNPCLEFLGFARLLASGTEFSESNLDVSPLAPPLVAVNVAYLHRLACLLSWQSRFPSLVPHCGAMGMQRKYYSDLI